MSSAISATARAGTEQPRRRPVGVGFLGAGNVLPAYLRALDQLVPRGLAVEGPIWARSRAARAGLADRRPGSRAVAALEDVLGDPGVDAVVIVTPPATHAGLVRASLAAGKHVLCEKPVATGPLEAAELFAAAEAAGRILLAAPFVHLSPSLRRLWALVADGELGAVHAARAHYGNPGSEWAAWYHLDRLATLGDVAVYNLKSLAAVLGPVAEVTAASATALAERAIGGSAVAVADPDTWQLVLRHESGALSSVLASHATTAYRRPAIELYGTAGTANLLGDDWDPHGVEIFRSDRGTWELIEPPDATWSWTDGLRELVTAIAAARAPLADPALDVHVLELVAAAGRAAACGRTVAVKSRFSPFERLRPAPAPSHHVHDRTRPAEEQ